MKNMDDETYINEKEEVRTDAVQMHQNGADAIDKGTTARLSDEDENSSIDPGEAVVEPIGDADVGSTSVTEEIAEGDTTGVDMDPLPVDSMLEDIKAISLT